MGGEGKTDLAGWVGGVDEAVRVIDAVRAVARPEILKFYSPDSCIASSRVVFDVLKRYDLKPRAVACNVKVWNPALVARVQNEGRGPKDVKELKRWGKEDGSWNVGIGDTGVKLPNRWDGHLIVLAFGKVLIDVSLDQASRPRRNIHLGPVSVTVPDDWLKGEALSFTENGCLLVYRARPDNDLWLRTMGWRGHAEIRKGIVDRICVKVERWLADNG